VQQDKKEEEKYIVGPDKRKRNAKTQLRYTKNKARKIFCHRQ
jgi:hypothetical protein